MCNIGNGTSCVRCKKEREISNGVAIAEKITTEIVMKIIKKEKKLIKRINAKKRKGTRGKRTPKNSVKPRQNSRKTTLLHFMQI